MRLVIALLASTSGLFAPAVALAGEELPSCEDAAASYIEDRTKGAGKADLRSEDYAGVLGRGTYLTACGVPGTTAVKVCAAVQDGKAVGVSVELQPADDELASCLREGIAALEFPTHEKLDVVRTTFAADDQPKEKKPVFGDTPNNAPPSVEPKRSGCGCGIPGAGEASASFALALVAGVAFARRRSRRAG